MAEKDFPQKFMKLLAESFKDAVPGMTEAEIETRIVEIEKGIAEIEDKMDEDGELQAAKANVKELAAVYKEPIKEHQAMIKFLVWTLGQRGLV